MDEIVGGKWAGRGRGRGIGGVATAASTPPTSVTFHSPSPLPTFPKPLFKTYDQNTAMTLSEKEEEERKKTTGI